MNCDKEKIVYKEYIMGDLTIENVPYEKVTTYVLAPETFYNINKISKENYNYINGEFKNKIIKYKGNNEK